MTTKTIQIRVRIGPDDSIGVKFTTQEREWVEAQMLHVGFKDKRGISTYIRDLALAAAVNIPDNYNEAERLMLAADSVAMPLSAWLRVITLCVHGYPLGEQLAAATAAFDAKAGQVL